jgi:hypothetical protein
MVEPSPQKTPQADIDLAAAAIERVLAWKIEEEMKAQGISKAEMAGRLPSTNAQLPILRAR